jgi:hypothetical protein
LLFSHTNSYNLRRKYIKSALKKKHFDNIEEILTRQRILLIKVSSNTSEIIQI